MRRLTTAALVLFLVGAFPALGTAQVGFFVGGGATVPAGDYGEYAKTGWVVSGGIHTYVGDQGLGLFGQGFYGSNGHDEYFVDPDEKTNIYGGYAGATYRLGDPTAPGVFLIGKVGALVHDFDSGSPSEDASSTNFSGGAGAGFVYPGERISPWVTAEYIYTSGDDEDGGTNFIPISIGVTIRTGGDG
jgi:hypothetical protein